MIAKLYDYFGVLGLSSIVVWMAAVVLMAIYARKQRQRYCLLALVVAGVGVFIGDVSSDRVSAIRLDRRDEMAAAQKIQREQAAASGESGSAAPALQFAEGNPEDTLPDYRKQGKQVRDAGRRAASTNVVEREEESSRPERYMRQEDLLAANKLDRVNLMIVRLVLLVALGLALWDYLAWFNSTAESRWALPLAGKWMDDLFRKSHAVLVLSRAESRMTPDKYLERMVRKGENVIYFGDHDPWAGEVCPRLKLWKWPLWSLPKLVYGAAGSPQGSEFALDAAWFGRYSVVITQNLEAVSLLEDMVGVILERHDTGASARKTLHLVWDFVELPPEETIASLVRVARDTNVKLAVWSTEPVTPGMAALFEEHFG